MNYMWSVIATIMLVCCAARVLAVEPSFSFVYDGKPSADLLENWKVARHTKKLDRNRSQLTITYSDPATWS